MTKLSAIWRDRRGTTAVEMALVALPLFLTSFAGLDLGLILWTRSSLEAVAATAARCGAIQAAGCTGSNSIESYVTAQARIWILASIVPHLTVNVNSSVNTSSCPAISIGTFETVEITTSFLASGWLPPPFGHYTIDVCASYAKS